MLNKIKEMRRTIEAKKAMAADHDERFQAEIWDLERELEQMRRESGFRFQPEDGPLPMEMQMLKDDLADMLEKENSRGYKRNYSDANIFVRDLLYRIADLSGGFVDDWGEYPEEWTKGITEPLEWHVYGRNDVIVEFIPDMKGDRPFIKVRIYR